MRNSPGQLLGKPAHIGAGWDLIKGNCRQRKKIPRILWWTQARGACAPASVRPAGAHTGGGPWWPRMRERVTLPISTAKTTKQRRQLHFSLISQTPWPRTTSADASGSGMAHRLCAMPITCPRANYVNSVTTKIDPPETHTRVVDHRPGARSCSERIKT